MSPHEDRQKTLLDDVVRVLEDVIINKEPTGLLPEVLQSHQGFVDLYGKLAAYREHALAISNGNLFQNIRLKGRLAGSMRALQANLRHLTWQTQMIASGDFTQRVDFMGDFSVAFNSMTKLLARAKSELKESETRYRLLAENVLDVIWTIDLEGRFTYVSPSVVRLLDKAQDEVLGRSVEEVLSFDSVRSFREKLRQLLADEAAASRGHVLEMELPRRDGSSTWIEVVVGVSRDDTGKMDGIIGVARDITERKRMQDELKRIATIDPLTGVANRRYFMESVAQEMLRSERYGNNLSLLFIDIDHFKQINDTYGHSAGDEVLLALVSIGHDTLRTVDLFCRWGGEEFAAFLPETGHADALYVAERLRRAFEQAQVQLADGRIVTFTVSIGVATRNKSIGTLEELLREADLALYEAKYSGRNCIRSGAYGLDI